jgi:hypothetical protein
LKSLARATSALFFVCATARADDTHARTYSEALFVEAGTGFIPYANDVRLMLSVGLRFAKLHEVWLRGGFMPTGDDIRLGFGAAGYRALLRPGRVVRPLFGGLFAGLPETCSHDADGQPACVKTPIFIFAATAGVRFEPVPWLGIQTTLSLGLDSYPNPFGMVELGIVFTLPLT